MENSISLVLLFKDFDVKEYTDSVAGLGMRIDQNSQSLLLLTDIGFQCHMFMSLTFPVEGSGENTLLENDNLIWKLIFSFSW